MRKNRINLIIVFQVIAAAICAFVVFGVVENFAFSIYLKLNDGIYPPFMPTKVTLMGGFFWRVSRDYHFFDPAFSD